MIFQTCSREISSNFTDLLKLYPYFTKGMTNQIKFLNSTVSLMEIEVWFDSRTTMIQMKEKERFSL